MSNVDRHVLDYVKENVSWSQWKNRANRENIIRMFSYDLEIPTPLHQDTMQKIWRFYFRTCFPDNGLPLNMTAQEAFRTAYFDLLSQIDMGTGSEVSPALLDDERVVFQLISSGDYELQYASDRIKNNREFALRAVAADGTAFQFFPEHLKQDREIIETALQFTSFIFEDLPAACREDRALILIALKGGDDSMVFDILPESLSEDKEIILLMVQSYGLYLQCVSDTLRRDSEVIEAACSQNPEARQYARPAKRSLGLFEEQPNSKLSRNADDDADDDADDLPSIPRSLA
ncbi:MAG: DUF4116 domain-containing protein [Gammaproteobacteria bacterium]|nr:DUF4116 domain-containing protein [Gammaproteobacteria bacterium]